MTKLKQCKGGDSNYSDVELDRVDERCVHCGKRMTNIKYIYYDLDSGNYICKTCDNKYGLNSVPCAEMDY